MLIIETPIFTKLVNELMSDDEYRKLQEALVNRPDMGALIKNSGGLRKMRWAIEGHGKSGACKESGSQYIFIFFHLFPPKIDKI